MKKHKETIGIDVSKLTIDVYIHTAQIHEQFENRKNGFSTMLKWIRKQGVKTDDVFICFENTGFYSLELASFLSEKKIPYAMEMALNIKRSMGVVRGKNDKVDAKRIAEYAYLRRGQLKESTIPSEKILKMKCLLSLRERMVSQRSGYMASSKELKSVFTTNKFKNIINMQQKLIEELQENIEVVETDILELIKSDETMDTQYKLVTSVKGIGFIAAAYFLVTTNCFTAFTDSRKYACYAGTAPFANQSGTSINGKSKVSHLANKRVKAILLLCASSAKQHDPELREYYQRRIEKGKNKMSTINIIKNKLIHRVFAVVKRGTPYVTLSKHAA